METFQVPAEKAGEWALNGKMLLPPQFDANKKYSVLVYVYGGPTSQTVSGRIKSTPSRALRAFGHHAFNLDTSLVPDLSRSSVHTLL